MTREDMIKVLENERECVSRDCEYDCAKCDLVLPREQILETYNDLLEMLSKEEAKSKRHGHWTDRAKSILGLPTEACSECAEWSVGYKKDYCPHCGAKMDEVQNE